MSEEDQSSKEEGDTGAPAWVMTFADLMSLLMCFFVLLLAFSEMDAQKFKQLSGSMKQAFGVQREISADDIPKGTSIIAMEFSPGIPQPTPLPVVEQNTTDDTKDNLEFSKGEEDGEKNLAERMYAAAVESIREEAEKPVAPSPTKLKYDVNRKDENDKKKKRQSKNSHEPTANNDNVFDDFA